jgi:hypothetical protein
MTFKIDGARGAFVIASALVCLLVASCGGGGGSGSLGQAPGPTAVLFVIAPPASLAVNASTTLQAAATYAEGTSGNMAVTWTVQCASAACGSFGPSANAAGVTYTAPDAIPSGSTVKITASSVADPSKTVSATVTIVSPIPIVVNLLTQPPASLQVGATSPLVAMITNDTSANPEVTWSVACGSSVCGSFNPTTTGSGASTVYTAPTVIPSSGLVTLTATSATDPTKSISVSITITAAAGTLADGTYVFQVLGPPGSNANFVTGAFTASGGHITGGEQDSISYTTDSDGNVENNPLMILILGGSYSPGPDGNLVISLTLADTGTEILVGTVAGAGTQGFVGSLNGAPVSGSLERQSAPTTPSRGYAMTLSGGDQEGSPLWLGGILNIDGSGTISGTGSELDLVDGQALTSGVYAVAPGTVSAPDAYGRIQIQLQQSGTSMLPPLYLAGYGVDATRIRLIQTAGSGINGSFQGVLAGLALAQGASTGQFSAASLAGTSYVFAVQGEDSQGALQVAGVFAANASGSVSGTLNWADLSGKSTQSPLALTGSYTVDSAGRVTLTQLTDGMTFAYSLHGYLASNGSLLLLSNDAGDAFIGQGFLQQPSALTVTAFSGTYGLNASIIPNTPNLPSPAVGAVTVTASGAQVTVSGFADFDTGGPDFAVSGSFMASTTGVFAGTLTGFNQAARSTANNFSLYLIDSTRAIAIETEPAQLLLGYLQSAPPM